MLFDENDLGFISFIAMPENDDKKLYSTEEGFTKGNMFPDEYKPYKNYKTKQIQPTNKKEEKLFKIMSLGFAITDLNLFLDLHPDNQEKYQKFKSLKNLKENLEEEYIKEYGPLTLNQVNGKNFNWVSDFPWEKTGGSKYV